MKLKLKKIGFKARFFTAIQERRMKKTFNRTCNICDQAYVADSRFSRFCRHCKESDELFRYYEWLPTQA